MEEKDGRHNWLSRKTNTGRYHSGWRCDSAKCTDTPVCGDHALDHWLHCVGSRFGNRAFSSCSRPFDLQTTITLQQLQPQLPSWVSTPIVWASLVDNPIPSTASFIAWFVVLSLIGVVVWRRGGSPIP